MIADGSEEVKADAEEPSAEPDAASPHDATTDDFDCIDSMELDQDLETFERGVAFFSDSSIDVLKSAFDAAHGQSQRALPTRARAREPPQAHRFT